MTATVTATQDADGWYVVVANADQTVMRTQGKRLTVAVIPDDDDQPADAPLEVSLAPEGKS